MDYKVWLEKKEDGLWWRCESSAILDGHNSSRRAVMEFTGLKSKDGKDIYEGDWVKLTIRVDIFTNPQGQVVMINGCWSILNAEEPEDSIPLNKANYGIEILGNVFENPELISNKE